MTINWGMLSVFLVIFVLVTLLGLFAGRWRQGDLNRLQEWGLAGRRFGTLMSWFLIGGDIYTAYTFIAIPGGLYAGGAVSFYSLPYAVIGFILFFVFMPRLWIIARHRGYVTPADFVRERFGSGALALVIALTGILATLPYIATQMYGIQVTMSQMGIPTDFNILGSIHVDLAQIVAFGLMAIYTYNGGLRAPAMISIVKVIMIWIVIIVAMVVIPAKLGGFGHIFAVVPPSKILLEPGTQYSTYLSLMIGQALALYLYPHALTGVFSANSRKAVQRNAIFLPIYSFLLGFTALLGYMAIAAGIKPTEQFGTNSILAGLLAKMFPDWFVGFSLAAIAVGALVPAAVMSIAAASLFTRNIYKEYIRPSCTEREETQVAKFASLTLKFGALIFILLLPSASVLSFQQLGGLWILQTLPAVFVGLYTNWFHPKAMLVGWAAGMLSGTWMAGSLFFKSSNFPLHLGSFTMVVYAGVLAVAINLAVCLILTPILRVLGVARNQDATAPSDFEVRPVRPSLVTARGTQPAPAAQPVPGMAGGMMSGAASGMVSGGGMMNGASGMVSGGGVREPSSGMRQEAFPAFSPPRRPPMPDRR